MQRTILSDLVQWKNSPARMPLLIRGARQVGKTYAVSEFARVNFRELAAINFELNPEYKDCFDSLNPQNIINKIKILSGYKCIPGETLLFLDEIQEAPKAITALRYFKEQMPELHVIGAGSLLEFALREEGFHMPVGRIESLYMKPLSFYEYLLACDNQSQMEYLSKTNLSDRFDETIHTKLEELTRYFFVIGGMPAVVSNFLTQKDLDQTQKLQLALLNTYRNDFSKYASTAKHKYLERIFDKSPTQIGKHFRYANIDPDMQSRDLKFALNCLIDAGVINLVYATNASGLPLNAEVNEKKFKLAFVDIGLVNANSLIKPNLLLGNDLMQLNKGNIAEQFVAQELLAYEEKYIPAKLYYWERDKPGATAEVDYVIAIDKHIIPIEVKAGKTGRLKSLHYFLEHKKAPIGIRISMQPLSFEKNILTIPFYLIHQLERLVKSCLKK